MRRWRARLAWIAFGAGAAVLLAALGWMSWVVDDLAAERAAAATAREQERLSLALWRMDNWLAPRLASEAARPYFHYLPEIPAGRPYDRMLAPLGPDEPREPSPLATFDDELVVLHLMVRPDGMVTSPQLDQSEWTAPAPDAAARRAMLESLVPAVGGTGVAYIEKMIACQEIALDNAAKLAAENTIIVPEPGAGIAGSAAATKSAKARAQSDGLDYNRRLQSSNVAQQWAGPGQTAIGLPEPEPALAVGFFAPVWIEATDGARRLCYFRRVESTDGTALQGFVVDWPRLSGSLLGEVADVFDGAALPSLEPTDVPGDRIGGESGRLATVPARLAVPAVEGKRHASFERAALAIAWIAALAAIGTAGLALRTAQRDAARRARFAGTVTHELRTPLTTFQLYTDMLASDMVPPEDRGAYIATLRDESHRLGELVENVLAYARIEQGRHRGQPEALRADELVERVREPLDRRAREAGMQLEVESAPGGDTRYRVDPESVGRILFNLVDNAAKYGGVSGNGTIELRTESRDGRLHLVVADHGAGIEPGQRGRLFRPFERGQDDRTQAQRGIGLGLALSRELATAMGGDLRFEPTPGGGASFRLVVG